MKLNRIVLLIIASSFPILADSRPQADWLIIGAGPAGIATIGVLLDIGVDPQSITWLDPEFNVGRLGSFYNNVPANSKAKEFIYFVNACKVFQECVQPAVEAMHHLDPEQRYTLGAIVEPLKSITDYLRTKIVSVQESLVALYYDDNAWRITTDHDTNLVARHVVLATGAHPRTLDYETHKIVPLDIALDKETLHKIVQPEDVVGVVGGAHSAILLLKFLSEMPVKFIYNLYRSPIVYAPTKGISTEEESCGKGINVGIKGEAAEWAKNVLEKNPPANLTRLLSTPENLKSTLALCSKVIYALGYERNPLPLINGTTPITQYNEKTGYIAPGLFGIGVAFPDYRPDTQGIDKVCIGLDCFMEYAHSAIPLWVAGNTPVEKSKCAAAQMKVFKKMESLFTIYPL